MNQQTIPSYAPEHEQQVRQVFSRLEELKSIKNNPDLFVGNITDICSDTMDNIAPMAEQLGMMREQQEMLDLAVLLGYPEDYAKLKQLLQEAEASCELVFKTFSLPLRAMLDDLGIEYTFKYRMKSIYSIWRKMRVAKKEFDDVYDLFASRIVYKPGKTSQAIQEPNCIDNEPEVVPIKNELLGQLDAEKLYCWRIYTVIASLYRIHPDRIRNWITYPKPSGYQALQITVMGPDCNWIEIQIRSERMDYEAEYGSANHWKYKQEHPTK